MKLPHREEEELRKWLSLHLGLADASWKTVYEMLMRRGRKMGAVAEYSGGSWRKVLPGSYRGDESLFMVNLAGADSARATIDELDAEIPGEYWNAGSHWTLLVDPIRALSWLITEWGDIMFLALGEGITRDADNFGTRNTGR